MSVLFSRIPSLKVICAQALVGIVVFVGFSTASTFLAEPLQAQRERNRDRDRASERPQVSEGFLAVYGPLQTAIGANDGSAAGVVDQFPALIAQVASADEKNFAGSLIFNAGVQTGNQALQLQGVSLMIESGKVPPENAGRFNFIAYQLANIAGQYARSRDYLQTAIDLNFRTEQVQLPDMQIAMAESYISEERYQDGVDNIINAIVSAEAMDREVPEGWYRRGVQLSYDNELVPEVYTILQGWLIDYPSQDSWQNSTGIVRNLNTLDAGQMLDMMRLAHRVGVMTTKYDYIDYVEAADARKLPGEVKRIIEEGYNTGLVSRDDIDVADALVIANDRIDTDKADLPLLEADARLPDASFRTVVAAGDALLSYEDYAGAEVMYTKALEISDLEQDKILTRLGIAQIEQSKLSEATVTLGRVGGIRFPIAQLWIAHAAHLENVLKLEPEVESFSSET